MVAIYAVAMSDDESTPPSLEALLRPEEVMEILQVSRTTLHTLTKGGAIAYHTIGNQTRYNRADLLAYLKSTRSGP
jgi:excisionase family DNA binding protein